MRVRVKRETSRSKEYAREIYDVCWAAQVQPAKAVMFIPGQGFRPFLFSQCFDHASEQQAVYNQSARDAVCSVLNGFNAWCALHTIRVSHVI